MSDHDPNDPNSAAPPAAEWVPPSGPPPQPGPSGPGFGPPGQQAEQPWDGYGLPPPPPPRGPGTNGFAIAALVLGILGVFVLSIIFALVALHQTKRTGQSGKGMAIAGLVLGIIWMVIIGLAVFAYLGDRADRDSSGDITNSGDVNVQDLEVGDCLNGLEESDLVLSVEGVACFQPHESEVYAAIAMDDGEWPGLDGVTAAANQSCSDDMATNHPDLFEDDSVEIFFFHPTSASWREGDREIVCVALYPEPRSGSLQAD